MGGAELECLVPLGFHDVDDDDVLGARQPCALDRAATDTSAADHDDGVTRSHVGGVDG